ncbi:MAG: hypothetical protein UH850_11390 [Paludibacteraceae bacterium]|nr:hypothetical protein [Paludibacteraceae bacterium]
MKKINLQRKEITPMDDERKFGECECCGNEITDADDEYYVDSEGRTYCSIECVLEHCGIEKIEI